MSEFDISKGIDIPDGRASYPFEEMEVGDSFFIPCEDRKEANRRAANARNASYRYVERKYMARLVDGGVRVWRTF